MDEGTCHKGPEAQPVDWRLGDSAGVHWLWLTRRVAGLAQRLQRVGLEHQLLQSGQLALHPEALKPQQGVLPVAALLQLFAVHTPLLMGYEAAGPCFPHRHRYVFPSRGSRPELGSEVDGDRLCHDLPFHHEPFISCKNRPRGRERHNPRRKDVTHDSTFTLRVQHLRPMLLRSNTTGCQHRRR